MVLRISQFDSGPWLLGDWMPANQITENIWIGSWQDGQWRPIPPGVTAVFNVAKDLTSRKWDAGEDVMLCQIPLTDGGNNSDRMIKTSIEVLLSLLEDGHKVLVHCHVGKSRSVSVVAAALALTTGVTFDEAVVQIREKRSIAEPAPGLRELMLRAISTLTK